MRQSDEEIVQEVLAGEKQLFGLLVDRYQQPIYNLMLRYTGNSAEAADLTQDAFIRSYERLWRFRTSQTFFPWLYRLAINLARDWYRQRSRFRVKVRQLEEDQQGWLAEQAEPAAGRELEQVERGLHRLPETTREILILRYRHDQSIQEVARAFHLSESATKMRIKRGLAQLREILDSRGDL